MLCFRYQLTPHSVMHARVLDLHFETALENITGKKGKRGGNGFEGSQIRPLPPPLPWNERKEDVLESGRGYSTCRRERE